MAKYEFRSSSGVICCSGDDPTHLCSSCQQQALPTLKAEGRALLRTAAAKSSDPLLKQDPNYSPKGQPPSGYDFALGKFSPEGGPSIRDPRSPNYSPKRDTPPDGYALAIRNRRVTNSSSIKKASRLR